MANFFCNKWDTLKNAICTNCIPCTEYNRKTLFNDNVFRKKCKNLGRTAKSARDNDFKWHFYLDTVFVYPGKRSRIVLACKVEAFVFALEGVPTLCYDCAIASTDVMTVCRYSLLYTIIAIKSCYNVGICRITSVFNVAFLVMQALVLGNRVGV